MQISIGGDRYDICTGQKREDVAKSQNSGYYTGFSGTIKTVKRGWQKVEVYSVDTSDSSFKLCIYSGYINITGSPKFDFNSVYSSDTRTIKAKWNADLSVSGYQIKCCKTPDFSESKTVSRRIKNNKTRSVSIGGLEKNNGIL